MAYRWHSALVHFDAPGASAELEVEGDSRLVAGPSAELEVGDDGAILVA